VDGEGESELKIVMGTVMSPKPTLSREQSSEQSGSGFETVRTQTLSHSPSPSTPLANERSVKLHRRKSRDQPPSASKAINLSKSPTADSMKAKRASLSGLPPAAPIPGLGSLTAAVGSGGAQPVASWVGSVGKKWEEIQRGPTYVIFFLVHVIPSAIKFVSCC
jgi:hypothetical protein